MGGAPRLEEACELELTFEPSCALVAGDTIEWALPYFEFEFEGVALETVGDALVDFDLEWTSLFAATVRDAGTSSATLVLNATGFVAKGLRSVFVPRAAGVRPPLLGLPFGAQGLSARLTANCTGALEAVSLDSAPAFGALKNATLRFASPASAGATAQMLLEFTATSRLDLDDVVVVTLPGFAHLDLMPSETASEFKASASARVAVKGPDADKFEAVWRVGAATQALQPFTADGHQAHVQLGEEAYVRRASLAPVTNAELALTATAFKAAETALASVGAFEREPPRIVRVYAARWLVGCDDSFEGALPQGARARFQRPTRQESAFRKFYTLGV